MAVVRIKRHLNRDPLEAVLLNCKKRKLVENDAEVTGDITTVLKFAGTIENPEEDVFKHIKKPTKAETEEQYKKHTTNIIEKIRQERRLAVKNSRLKVVNTFRSNDGSLGNNLEVDTSCAIVDIEVDSKAVQEDSELSEKTGPQYVYDLYYTSSDDFGDADLNELISVYPLSDNLIYGSHPDNDCNRDSESDCSEDSNAENNWKNDYPDESDVESTEDHSINEGDMFRAMKRVTLDGEDDLSSDDYEEAYGRDHSDDEHGNMYARFKAKHTKDDFCYYEDYDESCTP